MNDNGSGFWNTEALSTSKPGMHFKCPNMPWHQHLRHLLWFSLFLACKKASNTTMQHCSWWLAFCCRVVHAHIIITKPGKVSAPHSNPAHASAAASRPQQLASTTIWDYVIIPTRSSCAHLGTYKPEPRSKVLGCSLEGMGEREGTQSCRAHLGKHVPAGNAHPVCIVLNSKQFVYVPAGNPTHYALCMLACRER